MGADSARNRADGDGVYRAVQPRPTAAQLIYPHRQLEAEGGWLGVDAMGPPYHEGGAIAEGGLCSRFGQRVELFAQEGASLHQLHRQGSVEHVR